MRDQTTCHEYNYGRSRRKHRMDLALTFSDPGGFSFAKAKEFGDYGNSRANQAAFTSGRPGRKKATSITKAWKSPRPWRQLQRKSEREFPLIPGLRE
jgi:hypothetical protein